MLLFFSFGEGATGQVADHAEKMEQGLRVFTEEVAPLLKEHCLDCHGGDDVNGEFDLATRAGLVKGGALGPAIVPERADESLLYQVTAHLKPPFMPHESDRLPEKALDALKRWIEYGAPYDSALVEKPRIIVDHSVVTDEDRQFWAYRRLPAFDPDDGRDIDSFVERELKKNGLSPSPTADRRTLIQRATLDLTGLPATLEEIKDFLQDSSDEAWVRVIDRLLDSPHYGERWGRHWLDLARYADSGGFEHDNDRPFAYPYRDFVIKALNSNLPYDTFVKWQLAGDELAVDSPLAWQATGFLACGVRNGQITEREGEPERYDSLDDWLNTLGNTFLGMSLGCARCHDHKFDPIPSADYYGMAAIFATATQRWENVRLELTDADREAIEAYNTKLQRAKQALADYESEIESRIDAATSAKNEFAIPSNEATAAWVYLKPTSVSGIGSPAETNPIELHRTQIRVEEVSPFTYQATFINGGHAGYRFLYRTRVTDLRGLSIEFLPDLENPKGAIGMDPSGEFLMGAVTITATPIKDGQQGKANRVDIVRADATEAADLAKRMYETERKPGARATQFTIGKNVDQKQALFVGWDQLPKSDELELDIRLPCNRGTPKGRLGLGKVRLKFLVGEPTRSLLEPAIDGELWFDGVTSKKPTGQAAMEAAKANDSRWRELATAVESLQDQVPPIPFQTSLVVTEGKTPAHWSTQSVDFWKDVYQLRRGSVSNKMGIAEPKFLQVVSANPTSRILAKSSRNKNPLASGRRSALAEWIVDVDSGAGQLAARVMVNRLWQHHFGEGIVSTPSSFGVQGSAPTHPELLDWMASKFVASGWDVKAMHRLIMSSKTYRQSAAWNSDASRIDPKNLWLWRYAPYRLEAEVIRDRMLAASGILDTTMYGPGTLDQSMRRRSIYFTVKRSELIPSLVQLNWPDTLQSLDKRSVTTVAPQALLMMNNRTIRDYALAFAEKLHSESNHSADDRVRFAYELAFGRPATEAEVTEATKFLELQQATYTDKAEKQSLADFCQVLFGLNEFCYMP